MEAKKIVKNSIKLVISETFYGLILALINLGKNVIRILIENEGANSEIQRLKGEGSIAWVETLMNYNNSLRLLGNGLMLIVIILMGYSAYKYITNTFFENKE